MKLGSNIKNKDYENFKINWYFTGIWKRRFPLVDYLRNSLPNAIKIINATAILHNMSILWGEIGVDQLDGRPDPNDQPALPEDTGVDVNFDPNDLMPAQVRDLGKATRDNIHRTMPNPIKPEHRL